MVCISWNTGNFFHIRLTARVSSISSFRSSSGYDIIPYNTLSFCVLKNCYPSQLVLAAHRHDNTSPLLQSLHLLRVAERITFRLAVLTYHCLHGSAHEYLSRQLLRVSDIASCQWLCSSSLTALAIFWTFCAALTSVCNSLPGAVHSSASLALFRKSLKMELFTRSYSGWLTNNYTNIVISYLPWEVFDHTSCKK